LNLHVATVDHRLRPESASEALAVGQLCVELQLPHTTLVWQNASAAFSAMAANSATARQARYDLLHAHAKSLGAGAIVLGHTMDDQAETVFMRAQRARPDSGTRGLAGMAQWATFNRIRLWRPLLGKRRQDLRDFLQQRQIPWIDDPSNQDPGYERIRVRKHLAGQFSKAPSIEALARLAGLATRSRGWMNRQVADVIGKNVTAASAENLIFSPTDDVSQTVMREVIAVLVLVAGGLPHRSPTAKLVQLAEAAARKDKMTLTLGRCLISTRNGQISVLRESRNLPLKPDNIDKDLIHDGRILLQPSAPGFAPRQSPHIASLENFRPAVDDQIYQTAMELLDSAARSK
ncbi:MAG: tRNA lysidine(34) synthetase TilS, partial [Rhizobiaceae bacterium]